MVGRIAARNVIVAGRILRVVFVRKGGSVLFVNEGQRWGADVHKFLKKNEHPQTDAKY
jgi:hypothetical protein